MKLIVGLGNPGEKYKKTRHNAGHVLIDFLKDKQIDDCKIEKTDDFMNSSGVSVRKHFDFYKIDLNELFVAHDDLDLKLGEFKIQKGVGPKDHNGIESVNKALGNVNYWRIRIGVDNRDSESRIPGEEYVLQDFKREELETLDKVLQDIANELSLRG